MIWDHPRVCGEKYGGAQGLLEIMGSPPRMRGKVIVCVMTSGGHRITPAYAGKRTYNADKRRAGEDHPRVCGEKLKVSVRKCFGTGITPAYAGKRKRSAVCYPRA